MRILIIIVTGTACGAVLTVPHLVEHIGNGLVGIVGGKRKVAEIDQDNQKMLLAHCNRGVGTACRCHLHAGLAADGGSLGCGFRSNAFHYTIETVGIYLIYTNREIVESLVTVVVHVVALCCRT